MTRITSVVAFLLAIGSAHSALAQDTKEACIDADEAAQRFRLQGHLQTAREKLTFCAQSSCPGPLRAECAAWLAEVEAAVPTLVIEATDVSGRFVSDARVYVDDVLVAGELEGHALRVDPGHHRFRFTRSDGVSVTDEQTILEGEKNRKLIVHFPALPPAPESSFHSTPIAAYALGGVSVLALGSFAFFAIDGRRQENDLRDSCGTRCSDSDAHSVQTKYIVADISLAVAVVSLGAGVWLWVRSRRDGPAQSPIANRSIFSGSF